MNRAAVQKRRGSFDLWPGGRAPDLAWRTDEYIPIEVHNQLSTIHRPHIEARIGETLYDTHMHSDILTFGRVRPGVPLFFFLECVCAQKARREKASETYQ